LSKRELEIRGRAAAGEVARRRFSATLTAGRQADCEYVIDDRRASRRHFRCSLRDDVWWLEDLGSSNGTFLDGERLEPRSPQRLLSRHRVSIGLSDLDFEVVVIEPQQAAPGEDLERRYLDPDYDGPVGERTAYVRSVIFEKQKQERRRFRRWMAFSAAVLLVVAGIAGFQYFRLLQMQDVAVEIFYTMKDLELQVLDLRSSVDRADDRVRAEYERGLIEKERRLAKLKDSYAGYIEKLFDGRLFQSDEDDLILKTARIFGECEAKAPHGFVKEVKKYIKKWQSSGRLRNAMQLMIDNGYAPVISEALRAEQLPPQFLYLALQESGFNSQAVGPKTRFGYAKGMWQFIPMTAERFGLRVGSRVEENVYDPEDERHNFEKSTRAAARYLREIYRTDAQASGLLVMASYNWGEGNIIRRIRKLPKEPSKRNFWALLESHSIPEETYDYVFYIFSAAVIGENPGLFGFDHRNPLAGI
jgi:hypothetical protein